MNATVALSDALKNKLRTHLAQYERKLFPVDLGELAQLQTALKINESEAIAKSIRDGSNKQYPDLPDKQYLVACVKEYAGTRVWAVYDADQIAQMKAMHSAANIEWKLLVIPQELEDELRGTSSISPMPPNPAKQRRTCSLM